MNTSLARTVIVALILCFAARPTFAQEGSLSENPPCVIFPIQDLSLGNETRNYEQTITDSLTAWFQVAGFSLVAPGAQAPQAQEGVALSESQALSAAAALKAGLAVTGYYVVQQDLITIAIQVWDVPGANLVAGIQERANFNLAFFSALHDWVEDMFTRMRSAGTALEQQQPPALARSPAIPPPIAQTLGPVALPTIDFTSMDEGMNISLPGGMKLGSITNGRLSWDAGLAQGAVFHVLKQKPGYHDEWQTVRAAREIQLSPLLRTHSLAVEADWTFGQLAGLGTTLRSYIVPDNSFLFLSGYFFVQPPLSSAGLFVYHVDGSVGLGGYILFPPGAFIRLGVSTAVGNVLSITPVGIYTDVYLNLFNWWLETRAIGPAVIFLRQEYKFTMGVGNNLLGVGMINVQNFPPFTVGVRFEW